MTMTRRHQVAMSVFATGTIVGLYLDGWAHANDKPETFFTPWHLLLYSGFVTGVAWFALDGWRQKRVGVAASASPSVRGADVAGARITTAGLVLFITGAVGDGVWHEVFGVEVDLEALLSPTHLLLMIGGVLLVTGVLRAAWLAGDPVIDAPDDAAADTGDDEGSRPAPTLRSFAPVLVSLTLGVLLVSFFFMYLSAFDLWIGRGGGVRITPDDPRFEIARELRELRQIRGIASILFTNLLLLTPVLLVLRRWRPPTGTFTVLFSAVAIGIQGMEGFDLLPLVVPAVLGGIVADALIGGLRPGPGRVREVRIVAGVVPVVLWLSYFATYHLAWGLGWPVELWGGVTVLSALGGLTLSLLAFPMASPPPLPPQQQQPAFDTDVRRQAAEV